MRRIGRRAVLGIMLAGSFAAIPAIGVAAETSRRVVRVDNGRLDLGDVKAGAEGLGTFIIHNDGDSEMRVLHAKPS